MKTNIQSLTLCVGMCTLLTAFSLHATVVTYANKTPLSALITFQISDLAKDKVFTVEPHQQKQIDLGNTLPTSSKIEFLQNGAVIASASLPLTVRARADSLVIIQVNLICDQPIDNSGRITQGKIKAYAQTKSGSNQISGYIKPQFRVVGETQAFDFPITGRAN